MVVLTFFLGDDWFLIAKTKLGYVFVKNMSFFSFDPETTVEWPEFSVGREGVHEWDGAKDILAFLFIAATHVAGLEEGRAFLVYLIHCLVWDSLLMTQELWSFLLSPCSNDVLVGRGVTPSEEEMAESILARQDEYLITASGQESLKGANKPPNANRTRCHKDQTFLLEDSPSFPPMSALTSAGKSPSFMKCHSFSHPIFFDEKWRTIAAIVSAVDLRAFLGWLYGQFSLIHLQPLQVKSAQILVGKSLGKISVALLSCLARKNMPMFVTGRCLAGLMALLQRGFFWRWVAAAFVLSSGVDGLRFALRCWFWVFSGRVEAEMGTGARVPTFELVPSLLLENLNMVAARIGIGLLLLVGCARLAGLQMPLEGSAPWPAAWCWVQPMDRIRSWRWCYQNLLQTWRRGWGVVHANVGQNVTPHNPSLGLFLYQFFTYNEFVTSRVHPQQHKQPTNATTMVMELLAPPAVWIQWYHTAQVVGSLAHSFFEAAVEGFSYIQ